MRFNFFIVILLTTCSGILAQNSDGNNFNSYYTNPYANVVPPTPSAAGFIQYGNTPVDLSSGLPTISIPIYTLKVDGVEVPISLSYHASGVKVDDISSVVGLKWSLNVGGGVYRTIKDLDDFGSNGWINEDTEANFDQWLNAVEPDTDFYDMETNQTHVQNRVSSFDQWPDEFNYNFLGKSGEFIFKPDGSILKSVKNNVSISYNTPGFDIYDQSGNTFQFASNPNNTEYNENKTIFSNNYGEPGFTQTRDVEIVSWMLDNINTRNGKNIGFEYANSINGSGGYDYTYTIDPASQQIEYTFGCGSEGCTDAGLLPLDCKTEQSQSYKHYTSSKTIVENTTTNTSIKKITSQNVDIQFFYSESNLPNSTVSGWKYRLVKIEITDKIQSKTKSFDFKYDVFDGDQRLKLTEIQERGFENGLKHPYKFNYNDEPLPELGSTSKDYKGYYNGKQNGSLLPRTVRSLTQGLDETDYEDLADRYFDETYMKAGVLESIIYPTGGKTEFTYEPNAIGENIKEPMLKKFNLTIDKSGDSNDDIIYYNFNFISKFDAITEKIKFDVYNCTQCINSSCGDPFLTPKIAIYEYNVDNPDPNDPIDPQQIGQEITHNNLCGIHNYLSVGNSNNNSFNDTDYYVVQLKMPKQDYDESENISVTLEWYGKDRHQSINGDFLFQEHYLGGLRIKEIKDFDDENSLASHKRYSYKEFYIDDYSVYSSSDRNFVQIGGPVTFTSDLSATYYGDPFQEITGYTYTEVETKKIGGTSIGKVVQKYEPRIRFNSIKGGNLIERTTYDRYGKPVEIIENTYSSQLDETFDFKVPSLLNNTYERSCSPQGDALKSGYGTEHINIEYKSLDEVLNENFSTRLYSVGSNFKCITTFKEYLYNNQNLISKETTNTKYGATYSSSNELLSYNSNANPEGEEIEVFYEYPNDYPSEIILANVPISSLVTKKVYNSGTYVLGEFWQYNNGQIKAMYRYNKGSGTAGGGPSYVDANAEKMVNYNIDNDGNPIEVSKPGGTSTSYVWGYNGQYPVAKIENRTYGSLPQNLVNQIKNETNETTLLGLLDSLRNHTLLNNNTLVTTMTYKPMVGMSSVTDPKGDTQFFEYDEFGRLERIKDEQGNLLSENEYHYRPQPQN